jgi:hypothetical protein
MAARERWSGSLSDCIRHLKCGITVPLWILTGKHPNITLANKSPTLARSASKAKPLLALRAGARSFVAECRTPKIQRTFGLAALSVCNAIEKLFNSDYYHK